MLVFYLAVLPQFLGAGAGTPVLFVFALSHAVLSLLYLLMLTTLLHRVRRVLRAAAYGGGWTRLPGPRCRVQRPAGRGALTQQGLADRGAGLDRGMRVGRAFQREALPDHRAQPAGRRLGQRGARSGPATPPASYGAAPASRPRSAASSSRT